MKKLLILTTFILLFFTGSAQDTTSYNTSHLRYLTYEDLKLNVQKLFEQAKEPDWDWTKYDLTGIDKHAYIKIERDTATGLPTALDIYLLTPKSFVLPALLGSIRTTGHTHYFLGHEPIIVEP